MCLKNFEMVIPVLFSVIRNFIIVTIIVERNTRSVVTPPNAKNREWRVSLETFFFMKIAVASGNEWLKLNGHWYINAKPCEKIFFVIFQISIHYACYNIDTPILIFDKLYAKNRRF